MKKIIIAFIFILFMSSCAHVRIAPGNGSCPSEFPIKGNANSSLYHVPDSPYYYRTKAEVCFANEETARKMGYYSAKR